MIVRPTDSGNIVDLSAITEEDGDNWNLTGSYLDMSMTITEAWSPTMQLRTYTHWITPSKSILQLEQLWVSTLGNQEWRDVPHSGETREDWELK